MAIYLYDREISEAILDNGSYLRLEKKQARHVPTDTYEPGDYEEDGEPHENRRPL